MMGSVVAYYMGTGKALLDVMLRFGGLQWICDTLSYDGKLIDIPATRGGICLIEPEYQVTVKLYLSRQRFYRTRRGGENYFQRKWAARDSHISRSSLIGEPLYSPVPSAGP